MFKNYVTVALRNLWKNKTFSIINIIGLSIGISAALVIYLIVQYDFSFDKFEKDKDRIYRVVTNIDMAGTPYITSGVATPLGDAVKAELPGLDIIAKFHMFYGSPNVTIPQTTKKSLPTFKNQEGVIFADGEYLKLLSYKWLAGSPQTALETPFKVVLTEKQAKVFFPDEKISSIIGKQVIYDDSIKVFVSGIVEDILPNTDFNFQQFLSLATIASSGIKQYYGLTSWGSTNSGTQLWLKLAYGNTPAKVEAGLKTVFKKYYFINRHHDDKGTNFKLQPLSDLHFNDTYGTFNNRTAHKPTLYGLLAVAAFLLLLGCINFINLTTAQSSQRAKEIGIRKTMGGTRQQIKFQFLTETFFITIIASLLAVAATPVLMNIFGDFIPTELHFSLSNQQGIIIFLIGLIISVGMLSGLYPAFFLSKFNPVLVLKNQAYKGTASTRRAWVRKSLTVFQFFIAQVFIMATIVTVKQINFMINSDLGFKKDAIINFYTPYKHSNAKTPPNTQLVLLNQLKTMPGIQMVSLSGPPASQGFGSGTMSFKDGNKVIETDVQEAQGDTNFFRLYNIKLLAGRCALPQDSLHEYVINETYMHILGFEKPQDVLNKRIGRSLIVGVMNDFHQQSLHERIAPLVFSVEKRPSTNFSVALSPQTPRGNTWSATIHNIEVAYKKLYPESTFNYSFFDESIAKFYKSEQDISRLLKWATGLAVFISCMGLLGLVMYTTNQRRKEISIRKVMGATVTHIVSILSRDFTRLVVIAFVIATPVVWWLMHAWLENFAYRTNISWWIFLISGVIMVLLALLTLSIQTIKAATANPVKSLKEE